MNYTLSRHATGRFCDVTRQERKNANRSAWDTKGIERSSQFLQPAAISCQESLFVSRNNDKKLSSENTYNATVTKSLCITMGFCNARRYTLELSGVPLRAGERL
jgi:hypothetical protein